MTDPRHHLDSNRDPLSSLLPMFKHTSPIPPPAHDLEDRIMAAIALNPPLKPHPSRWIPVVAGVVLMASLGSFLTARRQPVLTLAETEALETFVEDIWGAIGDPNQESLLSLL